MATAGWLILLCPLAGSIVIALGYRVLPGRVPGLVGTLAITASFASSIVAVIKLGERGEEEKQVVTVAWDYASTLGDEGTGDRESDALRTSGDDCCLVLEKAHLMLLF